MSSPVHRHVVPVFLAGRCQPQRGKSSQRCPGVARRTHPRQVQPVHRHRQGVDRLLICQCPVLLVARLGEVESDMNRWLSDFKTLRQAMKMMTATMTQTTMAVEAGMMMLSSRLLSPTPSVRISRHWGKGTFDGVISTLKSILCKQVKKYNFDGLIQK